MFFWLWISIPLVVTGVASFLVVVLFLRDKSRSIAQMPSNRGLFRFNDGLVVRHVDPIEVMMYLDAHPEYSPEIHAKLANKGNPTSIRIQCDAIKQAFGVADYVGPKQPGLTIPEMTRLLYAFWEYIDLQKKSTNLLLTSAESTDAISIGSEPTATNDSSLSGYSDIVALQN